MSGLNCPVAESYGFTYYTAAETARAPRAPSRKAVLRFCFDAVLLGNAHASVTSQVQLGAPILLGDRLGIGLVVAEPWPSGVGETRGRNGDGDIKMVGDDCMRLVIALKLGLDRLSQVCNQRQLLGINSTKTVSISKRPRIMAINSMAF